ncbi:MAG: polyribonucleotide nucleotidyltransferase [Bdellovibrionales bacterium]|nr:polyribonucleotide nucleotidyltransferase [Bdellovibrionales bacterium]
MSEAARKIVELDFHGETLSMESGWVAKQASGAVIIRHGETMVMATVCDGPARPGIDFFPLVVEYQEKAYAAGNIPGGFFKREGRPGTHEILSCRLIDRPIRPLFPDGYKDEVQIIVNVLSADKEHSPDVLGICAASAALHVSHLPFLGPIAAVRVGRVNGALVTNPSSTALKSSDINIVIAATADALVMVEGGANCAKESDIVDALYYGHDEVKKLIRLQEELRQKAGRTKVEFTAPEQDTILVGRVDSLIANRLDEALTITDKLARRDAMKQVEADVVVALAEEFPERERDILNLVHDKGKKIARTHIVEKKVRIDGRGPRDVRPIECQTSLLPRAHGSALFTRGETQALVTATLGTSVDAQLIDTLEGKSDKTFMLHYNFPPFSTGEAKMLRGAGRREIGHGALAERAIAMVMPTEAEFPYVVRIVSEIMESNGSSSMASVCGGSLALMDAGVPIKEPVAGVAMGLISEGGKIEVITDILGDEDHFGDMDFKICGTKDGVTALQMDIKCDGLTRAIMEQALDQAREARLHILGEMAKTITEPKTELSKYAPRITTIKINPDKIRELIGPGGKVIQSITKETGVKIDISDDGTVLVASNDEASKNRALQLIEGIVEEPEIGKVYVGVVKRITDFGAFVEILPGTDGLVHISQLANERVKEVTDVVKEGDEVKVRVLDIDRQGRIRLSRKDALDA